MTKTKLDIFDFDGTLVFTPFPSEGKREFREKTGKKWPHRAWWTRPESLEPPLTWEPNEDVISDFRNSIDDDATLTVVMTGREQNTAERVKAILKDCGVEPEAFYFKEWGPTVKWKRHMITTLLEENPDIASIEMWEDRPEHADEFEEQGVKLEMPLTVNRIPERVDEKAIRKYARKTHYHPEDFTAYLMLGVPGSGKSTFVRENLGDIVVCNPDYTENYVEGAIKKFEENIMLSESDIAFDFVGTNIPLMKRLVRACWAGGYNPRVVYVRTSPVVASYRATIREVDDGSPVGDAGRHVSYTEIEHCFKKINECMPQIREIVGSKNISVFDGRRTRMLGECSHVSYMLREGRKKGRSAGVCVLRKFDDGWKILVLRLYKGYDLPKGKIEKGEDVLAAAQRECAEEAGIKQLDFRWGDRCSTNERLTMFAAVTTQDPTIRKNPETGRKEHHQALWMSLDDAEKKVYPHLRDAVAWVKTLV